MKKWQATIALIATTMMIPVQTASSHSSWQVALHHYREGKILSGSPADLIAGIRNGCNMRIGWGAHRAADPEQTIEHIATPVWIAVRNSETVEVQLDDFLINLNVLGEPAADHPRRERFGGTEKAVNWRANLKTDGSFNAVWYDAATGAFIERVPQRHPMKWFVDCKPEATEPLFSTKEG